MTIDINRILNEARVIGCSDLHFTYGITPIVRLNGMLRKMSKYPEMDEDLDEPMTEEDLRLAKVQVAEMKLKEKHQILRKRYPDHKKGGSLWYFHH